jgi:multicomponent Na+:H+ antiporter subunit E
MKSRDLVRAASYVAPLFGFWVAMSGMLTPFLLLSGLGAASAVAIVAARMQLSDREGVPWRFLAAVMSYWPWLLKEMLVSGWRVARIILDPRLPLSPALARFRPLQVTTVGIATHANSITLTPGTITVLADRDEFLVHSLTLAGGTGLAGSAMDQRVRRLEGSP